MLEYLNFFLLCTIFVSILYLYIRIKKHFPILKMAEELISNLGYGALQSDTKCQKLLECILTGNRKLYLGKVYTEEQLAKLNEEEVENFLIIMKPSYLARWCVRWDTQSLNVFNGSLLSASNNQSGSSERRP